MSDFLNKLHRLRHLSGTVWPCSGCSHRFCSDCKDKKMVFVNMDGLLEGNGRALCADCLIHWWKQELTVSQINIREVKEGRRDHYPLIKPKEQILS